MKRTTKKTKKHMQAKYRILQTIEDLILSERNEDKKEMLRILKKEFISNYGNCESFSNEGEEL